MRNNKWGKFFSFADGENDDDCRDSLYNLLVALQCFDSKSILQYYSEISHSYFTYYEVKGN